MPALSILCWGGIGDSLRNLSLVPHQFLHRHLGLRCAIFYRHWSKTGAHAHALPPESSFFQEMVARVPSLRWVGEVDEFRGGGRLVNRALRDLLKFSHGGEARYFPFSIALRPEEEAALPPSADWPLIGVQTHLNGMHTKRWALEKWARFLELLLAHPLRCRVLLLDSDPAVAQLCTDARVTHTAGLNLWQSIAMFDRFDLVVSIDSWSKYVAAWRRLPQVVVVPDQRAEYPGLGAEKLARDEFSGIWRERQNRIIGLEGPRRAPRLTLPSLADLSPGRLFAETEPLLAGIGRQIRN